MQAIIEPRLIDFSRSFNADIDCKFNSTVTTIAWAIKLEAEMKEDPLLTIAAEILLKDYVPAERVLSCYSGYAAGDDNIYPIE
jgi:hypothetical protein